MENLVASFKDKPFPLQIKVSFLIETLILFGFFSIKEKMSTNMEWEHVVSMHGMFLLN